VDPGPPEEVDREGRWTSRASPRPRVGRADCRRRRRLRPMARAQERAEQDRGYPSVAPACPAPCGHHQRPPSSIVLGSRLPLPLRHLIPDRVLAIDLTDDEPAALMGRLPRPSPTLDCALVVGLLGNPTVRGGKLPSALLVARIFRRQTVIGRRSGAFHHRHCRYSNQGTRARAPTAGAKCPSPQ
jgi:hypothetical protein